MKLIAILHTTEYRGDHDAEVTRVYEVGSVEGVANLAVRVGLVKGVDWIEIKQMVEEGDA